jgi:hypothetical protein
MYSGIVDPTEYCKGTAITTTSAARSVGFVLLLLPITAGGDALDQYLIHPTTTGTRR